MGKRGQAINRFQIQVRFPDGFRWEITSRRDVELTPTQVAECIEKYAADIRQMIARREAQQEPQ